jgi:hypothetical protein
MRGFEVAEFLGVVGKEVFKTVPVCYKPLVRPGYASDATVRYASRVSFCLLLEPPIT